MLKWFLGGLVIAFICRCFTGRSSHGGPGSGGVAGSRGRFTIDELEEFDMMDDD